MATQAQVKAFIDELGPIAVKVCKARGYGNAQVWTCICQAACETGWGTSSLMTKANAYFGIKAFSGWQGKVYNADTAECYDGKTYTNITACFRAYDSLEDSVNDYFDLLKCDRYSASLTVTTVRNAIEIIKAGGYATDPGYVNLICDVYESFKDLINKYSIDAEKKQEVNTDICYIVKSGDTLSGIASKYKTTYQSLAQRNCINDPNKIFVGQVIRIPCVSSDVLKIGDRVRLDPSAVYFDGSVIPTWVKNTVLYLRDLSGERAVISTVATGPVTGAVNVKYIIKA